MLWVCGQCGTRYAPGLPACPHCGSTSYRPDYQEDDVPNITSQGVHFEPGHEADGYEQPGAGTALADLNLPAGAAAALEENGITTTDHVAGKSETDLLAIKGVGPATVDALKAEGVPLAPAADAPSWPAPDGKDG